MVAVIYIKEIGDNMDRISSWLISIFGVMFWIFRIIVAIFAQKDGDFVGFIAFNLNLEIILLFITLLSLILIFKRKTIGGLLYVITYGYYFGGYLYTRLLPVIVEGNEVSAELLQNSAVAILALILSICTLIDILTEKVKRNKGNSPKTDWFFNNKETDRKLDEKADKNQYKIY